MSERERIKPSENLVSAGRILYLTKDLKLLKKQLEGLQLTSVPSEGLMEDISTDEILPSKVGLAYTGKEEGHLGKHALTGLRGGLIKPGDVTKGNFQAIVAGPSFGKGSSRIHAPLALQEAGINFVIADAERIFKDNCVNCGMYIVEPGSNPAQKLLQHESVPTNDVLKSLPTISQEIMKKGGLLPYFKAIEEKRLPIPTITTLRRPMTMAEKIISQKVVNQDGSKGIVAVKPGDECIAEPDLGFGYELQSPPARKVLRDEFGENIKARRPEKIFLHNDHTALLQDESSRTQRTEQAMFAKFLGTTVYEIDDVKGAPAICHTKMIEDHALPGQLILGNDSHTCTLGAVNALAVGKGAIDLAGMIAYDKMVLTVPESIRINFHGKFLQDATMKDFMLQFGASKELKEERIGKGKIFEFGGEALPKIPFDEQLKLTNMSVEILGFSGIIEPNKQILKYLKEKRNMTDEEISKLMVTSDVEAEYARIFDIDLSKIEPTVATPGDTQNGKLLSEIVKQKIKIQKAYIGSCTHGTVEDLKQTAKVLKGKKIAEGVKLFVQASSIDNLEKAKNKGYIQDLLDAGAELLPIGCGACMNAGPGSTKEGEVGIFATNRNFPGRTGKGETYLASPLIVAASAIKGFICGPKDID